LGNAQHPGVSPRQIAYVAKRKTKDQVVLVTCTGPNAGGRLLADYGNRAHRGRGRRRRNWAPAQESGKTVAALPGS